MNEYWDTVYLWVHERMMDMTYYLRPLRPTHRNYENVSHWAYNILVSMGKPQPKTQQFESVINGVVNSYLEGADWMNAKTED